MEKSDLFGPGHQHSFTGPACNYMKDTEAMYKEGTKILQDTPLSHKPTVPTGADSLDAAIQQTKEMGQNYVKKYAKKMLNWFLPSWA